MPIFYLVELTWPFIDIPVHPISLPLYILGLAGIVLWAYRRRTEDKFFLIWFLVVYVFFTLIPNKQWRYVTPLFPVMAISATSFAFFFMLLLYASVNTRTLFDGFTPRLVLKILFNALLIRSFIHQAIFHWRIERSHYNTFVQILKYFFY